MTTTIKINVNGNYIAKGNLTINHPGVDGAEGNSVDQKIEVGPSTGEGPIEQSFYVQHGSTVSLELVEKHADEWAAAEVEGKADTGEADAAKGDVG